MEATIIQRLNRVEKVLDELMNALGLPVKTCKKQYSRPKVDLDVASKHGLSWSTADKKLLLKARKEGKSYEDIAEVLGRTPRAVMVKHSVLRNWRWERKRVGQGKAK